MVKLKERDEKKRVAQHKVANGLVMSCNPAQGGGNHGKLPMTTLSQAKRIEAVMQTVWYTPTRSHKQEMVDSRWVWAKMVLND